MPKALVYILLVVFNIPVIVLTIIYTGFHFVMHPGYNEFPVEQRHHETIRFVVEQGFSMLTGIVAGQLILFTINYCALKLSFRTTGLIACIEISFLVSIAIASCLDHIHHFSGH